VSRNPIARDGGFHIQYDASHVGRYTALVRLRRRYSRRLMTLFSDSVICVVPWGAQSIFSLAGTVDTVDVDMGSVAACWRRRTRRRCLARNQPRQAANYRMRDPRFPDGESSTRTLLI
jgi:hypothetical protein